MNFEETNLLCDFMLVAQDEMFSSSVFTESKSALFKTTHGFEDGKLWKTKKVALMVMKMLMVKLHVKV